jgi:hypothetical protein
VSKPLRVRTIEAVLSEEVKAKMGMVDGRKVEKEKRIFRLTEISYTIIQTIFQGYHNRIHSMHPQWCRPST